MLGYRILFAALVATLTSFWGLAHAGQSACELILTGQKLRFGAGSTVVLKKPGQVRGTSLILVGSSKDRFYFVDPADSRRIVWTEKAETRTKLNDPATLEIEWQKGNTCQSYAAVNCLQALNNRGRLPRSPVQKTLRNSPKRLLHSLIREAFPNGDEAADDSSPEYEFFVYTLPDLFDRARLKKASFTLEADHVRDYLVPQLKRGDVAYLQASVDYKERTVRHAITGEEEIWTVPVLHTQDPAEKGQSLFNFLPNHVVALVDYLELGSKRTGYFLVLDSGTGNFTLWSVASLIRHIETSKEITAAEILGPRR